jgi:hypothetical protein
VTGGRGTDCPRREVLFHLARRIVTRMGRDLSPTRTCGNNYIFEKIECVAGLGERSE